MTQLLKLNCIVIVNINYGIIYRHQQLTELPEILRYSKRSHIPMKTVSGFCQISNDNNSPSGVENGRNDRNS
jgi:hypothetical protein